MLLNCGIGDDSWVSLEFDQGDQTSQSWSKSTLNTHCMYWSWSWNCNTLATWCKELTHWKRLLYWERLKAEGEEGDLGWDGWLASPITGHELHVQALGDGMRQRSLACCSQAREGVAMGLRRVRHDLVTEQQQQIYYFVTDPDLFRIIMVW